MTQLIVGDTYYVRSFVLEKHGDGDKLLGVYFSQPVLPGVNVAQCIYNHESPSDSSPPVASCNCGFYAYSNWDGFSLYSGSKNHVSAVVRGSDKAVLHRLGVRLQKIEVMALASESSRNRKRLAKLFPDVPVYSSTEELQEKTKDIYPIKEFGDDYSIEVDSHNDAHSFVRNDEILSRRKRTKSESIFAGVFFFLLFSTMSNMTMVPFMHPIFDWQGYALSFIIVSALIVLTLLLSLMNGRKFFGSLSLALLANVSGGIFLLPHPHIPVLNGLCFILVMLANYAVFTRIIAGLINKFVFGADLLSESVIKPKVVNP